MPTKENDLGKDFRIANSREASFDTIAHADCRNVYKEQFSRLRHVQKVPV
jgi:hypothetical protein